MDFTSRKGFKNRHLEFLPSTPCKIQILNEDYLYTCQWTPYKSTEYPDNKPAEGYIGTAKVIEGKYKGIGFHAWDNNDEEFIYFIKL